MYEEALEALNAVNPGSRGRSRPASTSSRPSPNTRRCGRTPATGSIVRLLDDVADAPDRYKMVATLMFFDMQNWSPDPKDLTNIERLMDNSGRRLDLARGGEKTQDIQKKIVFRLDELIKELENKNKPAASATAATAPNGGKPGSTAGRQHRQPDAARRRTA